jgi:hypothetical protein
VPDGLGHRASYNFRPVASVNANAISDADTALLHQSRWTKAFLATDCNDRLTRFADHHKTGLNAAAADGSVRWVQLATLQTLYSGWPFPVNQNSANNTFVDAVWKNGLDPLY